MLSDRVNLAHMGHRKPYMMLGLVLGALAFGGAGFVLPDRSFVLFAALIVSGSFSVAFFDSTTDGLAVDTTPREECGTVQGTMVGGRAAGFILLSLSTFALMMALSNVGTAIGEGVATGLTDNMGFSAVFWLLAGLNVAILLILWALFKLAPESVARVPEPASAATEP